MISTAKVHAKVSVPKITKRISQLEKELGKILNNPDTEEGEKILSSMMVQEQTTYLERKRHTSQRLNTEMRNRLEGETISKYWSQINREKTS